MKPYSMLFVLWCCKKSINCRLVSNLFFPNGLYVDTSFIVYIQSITEHHIIKLCTVQYICKQACTLNLVLKET